MSNIKGIIVNNTAYGIESQDSIPKLGMFKSIGLIGDSFTAGVYSYRDSDGNERTPNSVDISWGNQIARKYGMTVKNYGWGGATIKKWLEVDGSPKSRFDADDACDCYTVAFGINDKNKSNPSSASYDPTFWYVGLGDSDDTKDDDTFYGYLKEICECIHTKAPHAPIFIITPYKYYRDWNEAIKSMANVYTYVYDCDIYENCPYYMGDDSGYFMSHPTKAGHSVLAYYFEKIINKLINENESDMLTLMQ